MTEDHRTRVGIQRREKMRRRLIESALVVFAQKGVDASVIDDVIKEAGVARGTFYNYFRTNQEVLIAVGNETSNEVIFMIEGVVGDFENPVERLACGLRKFLQTCRDYPLFCNFIWRVGFNANSGNNLVFSYLPRHISEAREQGSFKIHDDMMALELIVGIAFSAAYSYSNRETSEDYPEQIVKHIMMCLGVPEKRAEKYANLPMPAFELPEDSLLNRTSRRDS